MPYRTTFDPKTRTWSGQPEQPFYSPNASVATIALAALSVNPDHIAQISDSDGSRMTNGELRQLAVRIALNLRSIENVQHGDVITLVANNHRLVAPAVLGAIALAAPVNFLHANFKWEQYVQMLRMTRPKVIFADAELVPILRQALVVYGSEKVALYTVDKQVEDVKFVEDLIVAPADPDAEELFRATSVGDGRRHAAVIAYSSGTTGQPKGASISHAMILQQVVSSLGNITADAKLLIVNLFWVSSVALLLATFMLGVTRIITAADFDANMIVRMVHEYGITSAMLGPQHIVQLLQSPGASADKLRTLRNMYWAGGGLPAHLVPLCERVFPVPVRGVYGLTELGGKVACSSLGEVRTGSVGQLCSGMSVKLLREANGTRTICHSTDAVPLDELCVPCEVGEISIRSTVPTLGYWGDKAASLAAVSPDGWYNTGDVGYFDADGNMFVVESQKDMIKCRTVTMLPSELENVVRQVPGVANVCVIGVPGDDVSGSDMPAAVVVRTENGDGERLQLADVAAFVVKELGEEKSLSGGVWFVDQMPMTPSGKLLRRGVKEWVLKWRAEEAL